MNKDLNDKETQKDVSELFFYYAGLNLIGKEKAESVSAEVVMVTGVIGTMGAEYARIKGIKSKYVRVDFQNKKVEYIDENDSIIDTLQVYTEDFSNPGVWLNKLYKDNNVVE